MRRIASLTALGLAGLMAVPALASDDHGHDHGAPAAPAGVALPRFVAVSEVFELVGILDGRQLTVYLDRFDDNTPVAGAKVELEIGDTKLALTPTNDGLYQAHLAKDLQSGTVAVTATITAGNESDLLAGDLVMAEPTHPTSQHTDGWRRYVGWSFACLAAVGAAIWAWRHRRSARATSKGEAA